MSSFNIDKYGKEMSKKTLLEIAGVPVNEMGNQSNMISVQFDANRLYEALESVANSHGETVKGGVSPELMKRMTDDIQDYIMDNLGDFMSEGWNQEAFQEFLVPK